MPLSIRPFRIAALAAGIVVGACSESPAGPGETPADLDQVLDELSMSGLAEVVETVGLSAVRLPPMPSASRCSYDGASGSFQCPTITAEGLTITRSFTLLGASGGSQNHFDPAATAAVRTTTTVDGTFASGGFTITLHERQVLTLSGLLTGTHVLNGKDTTHYELALSGEVETVAFAGTTTLVNVVLPGPGGPAWPLSGTMTIASGPEGPPPRSTVEAQITFNGTSTVPLTFTSPGATTQVCSLDLTLRTPLTCR